MHCTSYSAIPSCWDKKCNWWSSFLRQWITLNYLPFVLHKWLIIRAMYKIYNYIFTANKRTSLQFDTDNRITVYFVNCMVFLFPLFHNILLDFFNRKKNKKKKRTNLKQNRFRTVEIIVWCGSFGITESTLRWSFRIIIHFARYAILIGKLVPLLFYMAPFKDLYNYQPLYIVFLPQFLYISNKSSHVKTVQYASSRRGTVTMGNTGTVHTVKSFNNQHI